MNWQKTVCIGIWVFCSVFYIQAQQAYAIFDDKGEAITLEEMLERLPSADAVLFGELHNNPIAHWLEMEILQSLAAQEQPVILGMEMFERDQQQVLDEMYDGLFDLKKLADYTRTWPNYATDYKPLIKYALEKDIRLVASNIPRRYASFVFYEGRNALYKKQIPSEWLPPANFVIDTTLSSYAEVLEMGAQMAGHDSKNFLAAQAIKDATMAESMWKERKNNEILYHIHGGFHSKNKEGIAYYLKAYSPKIKVFTLQCQETETPDTFEQQNNDSASFYIQINPLISKSYE
jgi:uncharacterized iron-regulated protein